MAINTIAPGIYSTVRDLDTFVDSLPSTTGLIAFISERGEDNKIKQVTRSKFYSEFGQPNINYLKNSSFQFGPYVAASFLEESNSLYVIRCLPENATYSNLYVEVADIRDNLNQEDASSVTNVYDLDEENNIKDTTSLNTYTEIDDLVNGTTSDVLFAFHGLGRGEYYNNFQIDINPHPNPILHSDSGAGLYIVDIYKRQEFSRRYINVNEQGIEDDLAEYAIVGSYEVSFDPAARSSTGESQFIEDVINANSHDIKCIANKPMLSEISRRQVLPDDDNFYLSIDFSKAFIQSYTGESSIGHGVNLESGSSKLFNKNGTLIVNDDTGAGITGATSILANAYSGLLKSSENGDYLDGVLDDENYSYDVIFDAGYPNEVKTQIVTLASTRRGCFAATDYPDVTTPTAVIAIRKDGDINYNTPYGIGYTPYSKIYDIFTGKNIWVPPTVHFAGILAASDRDNELWYPVAGLRRAAINNIIELRFNASRADRENFTKYQINPIVKLGGNSYAFFGQRTFSKIPSARQDLNVVRLVEFIDKSLQEFCKNFIFDLSIDQSYEQIRVGISAFLEDVKNLRGLYNYSLDVYASDYDIKRRRVNIDVILNPVRAMEQIHLTFFIEQ